MRIIMLMIVLAASVEAASNRVYRTNTDKILSLPNPGDRLNPDGTLKPNPKGPPQILSEQQRKALSRITSKGFIIGQKNLPDGRKELTWTNGKDTVVTTQKVERVNAGRARDPRRAQIESVKAEISAAKAERDALKEENDKLKKK